MRHNCCISFKTKKILHLNIKNLKDVNHSLLSFYPPKDRHQITYYKRH